MGFPSLRVHVPVRSHADLVSGPAWSQGLGGAGAGRGGIPEPRPLPLLSALGLTASCTRSSGTSSCPSPCTRVSVSEVLLSLGLAPLGRGGKGTWDSSPVLMSPCPPGFVQFLQYYYQSGCLYRLRALGERHTMDLTVGESGVAAPLWNPDGGAGRAKSFPLDLGLSDGVISVLVVPPAEGFQSWMWRGLTFLLPFLFFGHVSCTCVPVHRAVRPRL